MKKARYILILLLWTAISLVSCQLLLSILMSTLLGENFSQPFWVCIYYILSYGGAFALIFLLPKKLYPKLKTNPEELGLKSLPTFTDIGLAPIGYVVYIIGASIVSTLLQLLPWFNPDQAQNTGFDYFVTGFDRFWAILALVFIAPIAEEIIMRGWLYGKLRAKLKLPLAVLLTSLLFALLHGQLNVAASVFILSIVLCSLREITGTIWSGIILHILTNGIAFYLLYIAF